MLKEALNSECGESEGVNNETKQKYVQVNFLNAAKDADSPKGKGSFAPGDETTYYAHKEIAKGVFAPQVMGQDYDDQHYHYEFLGWERVETNVIVPLTTVLVAVVPSAMAVPTPKSVENNEHKLYSRKDIAGMSFNENTTFRAVYKKVQNAIDAAKQNDIPDDYVATVFLPEIGHRWADGTYKPKLIFMRHSTSDKDNIALAKSEAEKISKELTGFVKWRTYNANGAEWNLSFGEAWNIDKPRIFVAVQEDVSKVQIPEVVIGAGDAIPELHKLVHNTDSKVTLAIDSVTGVGKKPEGEEHLHDGKVHAYKPGVVSVVVNVSHPLDEVDLKTDQRKLATEKVTVHVRVLPNVIAEQDLPAAGTAEAKFIAKHYQKVTYVAGEGGAMKSPVYTYWVRKGQKVQVPVPDVLADKGYVFKRWQSVTTATPLASADKRIAGEEEREALARMAIMAGKPYVAKIIRSSHKSTLAALQQLLEDAMKKEAVDQQNAREREKLATVADQSGKHFAAKIIRASKHSSPEALRNLLNSADPLALEREALARMAEQENKPWLAKIIRASKHSSLEALKNLLMQADIDPEVSHEHALDTSYILDAQKEVLASLAEDAGKHYVAKIIRASKKSSLEALKNLLHEAGVSTAITLPEPKPIVETVITAEFEKMKPMHFTFTGEAQEHVPSVFTLTNGNEAPANVLHTNSHGASSLTPTCSGEQCTIQGIPAVTDWKPGEKTRVVHMTFTTVDKYGREAEITVGVTIVRDASASTPLPHPHPHPSPSLPTPDPTPDPAPMPTPDPAPTPIPEPDGHDSPVVALDDVTDESVEHRAIKPEALAHTGSSVNNAFTLSAALASFGLAVGQAQKHRRRRGRQ